MKRKWLVLLGLLSLFLLSACAAATNPLTQAMSTPIPGIPKTEPISANPAEQTNQLEINLFFRYQQTGLLACETRTINIPKEESAEETVIQQLLAGPQASHTDLRRLFPHNTILVDTTVSGDILMVTLNEALLNDGIPDNWSDDPAWRTEAPLRRKLTIQSLVATITENFSYSYVQVFLVSDQASHVSTRLDSAYFLAGSSGPAELLYRDESLLMTMQNATLTILDAWYRRDYPLLYELTLSNAKSDVRPAYETFVGELDSGLSLTSFTASSGHSPVGSNRATVIAGLTCQNGTQEIIRSSIPIRLICEDGIWKVPYSELQRLMLLPD